MVKNKKRNKNVIFYLIILLFIIIISLSIFLIFNEKNIDEPINEINNTNIEGIESTNEYDIILGFDYYEGNNKTLSNFYSEDVYIYFDIEDNKKISNYGFITFEHILIQYKNCINYKFYKNSREIDDCGFDCISDDIRQEVYYHNLYMVEDFGTENLEIRLDDKGCEVIYGEPYNIELLISFFESEDEIFDVNDKKIHNETIEIYNGYIFINK